MRKCKICSSSFPAFAVTNIKDGKVESFELCSKCIESYLKNDRIIELEKQQSPNEMMNFLINFMQQIMGGQVQAPGDIDFKPCPKCNITFEIILKTEKIGCAYCYEHFKKPLSLIIGQLQGSKEHIGKTPKNIQSVKKNSKTEIQDYLNKQATEMKEAVKKELYEEAINIRDKLNAFEKLQSRLKEAIQEEDFKTASLVRSEMQKFIDR
jgi:protein arginine kinase activator